jgi:tetratricopeptide (TPR) repeat protein
MLGYFLRRLFAETRGRIPHREISECLRLEQFDLAHSMYRDAAERYPPDFDLEILQGIALERQGSLRDALDHYSKALALRPRDGDALCLTGNVLLALGQQEAAIEQLRGSLPLARHPEESDAEFGERLRWAGLLARDLVQDERYFHYCRIGGPDPISHYRLNGPVPLLGWAPHHGKRLLVPTMKGMGDTLHLVRYAADLHAQGAKVTFQTHAGLLPVVAHSAGVEAILPDSDALPEHEIVAPMVSLMRRCFLPSLARPAPQAYVRADPEKARSWGDRLAAGSGPHIGLCWAGNSANQHSEPLRSLALRELQPLFSVGGVTWHSLQVGTVSGELRSLPPGQIRDHADALRDFGDTAALVANLDLVISVDTAVAHLAGAMGKPVWIFVVPQLDLRWSVTRDGSEIYPSARLFRQRRPGNWAEAIASVRNELAALVRKR